MEAIPPEKTQAYTAIGSEELLGSIKQELENLGAKELREGFKAVHFEANLEEAYRIHLKLRTASRLLRRIIGFPAKDLITIQKRLSRFPFDQHFDLGRTYKVEAIVGDRGVGAPSSNDLSKAIRLAIEAYTEKKALPRPKVELKSPKITLVAYLHAGNLSLSLDSSGKSLHKRGYRLIGHPAPIKEHLGSALLGFLGYDGSQMLLDPMCGSGTLAIEAAFIALDKAPLIHRAKGDFGFEWFRDFDSRLWREVQDQARRAKADQLNAPIYASDIDEAHVLAAKTHALRARVEKFIHFSTQDFLGSKAPGDSGLVIMNLPYGRRLSSEADQEKWVEFYRGVGDTLKRGYRGYKAGILVSQESPYKFIGLKPKKKIPVNNGGIECRFLVFELY